MAVVIIAAVGPHSFQGGALDGVYYHCLVYATHTVATLSEVLAVDCL